MQWYQGSGGLVKDYPLHPSEDTNFEEKEAGAPDFILMILNNLLYKSTIAYIIFWNDISISCILILF